MRWAGVRRVGVDGVLAGWSVEDGIFTVGIGHAGSGEFGQYGFEGGAGGGSQAAFDGRHAVAVLVAQGQAAAARAVLVAELAVGVEAVGESIGQFGQ